MCSSDLIADLIHYRSRTESLVTRVSERDIETVHGRFRMIAYTDRISGATHVALVKGTPAPDVEALVRVHEPLSVVDLLDVGSRRHSWNVHDAMRAVQAADCGVIVLLHRPESPAELLDRARGDDAGGPASTRMLLRNYGIGAQILRDLKVKRMKVLSRVRRMPSMMGFDLEVTGYVQPAGNTD